MTKHSNSSNYSRSIAAQEGVIGRFPTHAANTCSSVLGSSLAGQVYLRQRLRAELQGDNNLMMIEKNDGSKNNDCGGGVTILGLDLLQRREHNMHDYTAECTDVSSYDSFCRNSVQALEPLNSRVIPKKESSLLAIPKGCASSSSSFGVQKNGQPLLARGSTSQGLQGHSTTDHDDQESSDDDGSFSSDDSSYCHDSLAGYNNCSCKNKNCTGSNKNSDSAAATAPAVIPAELWDTQSIYTNGVNRAA
jgi:hypothetical protein